MSHHKAMKTLTDLFAHYSSAHTSTGANCADSPASLAATATTTASSGKTATTWE